MCFYSGVDTRITPLGLLGLKDGTRINLSDWAIDESASVLSVQPAVIVVAGTSMNAGKTTTAAYLIKGLIHSGLRVGAAKVTGTGSGNDLWALIDAGASPVLDFTDAGMASTYRVEPVLLEKAANKLINYVAAEGVDVVVVEIADGLLQEETAILLSSATFRERIDGIMFAAADSMGAAHGISWLSSRNHKVFAISGLISTSPLAMREAAAITGLPILTKAELLENNVVVRMALRQQIQRDKCSGVSIDAVA